MAATTEVLIEAGMIAPRNSGVSKACIQETVDAHDQKGWNYAWLTPKFGRLMWIDHSEPSLRITKKQGKPPSEWKTYNSWHYARHGSVVDHHPKELEKDHVRWFVDPDTKLIDLRFYLQLPSGLIYMTYPIREFYRLEAEFFKHHGLCSGDSFSKKELVKVEQMMSDMYDLKGLTPFIPAQQIASSMMPTPRRALLSLEETLQGEKVPRRVRPKSNSK
jgi:hypothetical protein